MAAVEAVDRPIKVCEHPGGMAEFGVVKAMCCGTILDGIGCMCSEADRPMRAPL